MIDCAIPQFDVAQLCQRANLSFPARRLLRTLIRRHAELSPQAFLEHIVDARFDIDAILYLPYLMDKRSAVWWGCLCTSMVWHEKPTDKVVQAIQAALGWACNPTEDNRIEAGLAGAAAGWDTAVGALAMAAHWSDPPESLEESVPTWDMTARAVSGGICMAALEAPLRDLLRNYHRFALLGYKAHYRVIDIPAAAPATLESLAVLAHSHLPDGSP